MYFIIFVCMISLVVADNCLPDSCVGQYQLAPTTTVTLNITGETHNALSVRVRTEVKASIIIFKRYWNYEYEGGSIDGNSGMEPVYDYPQLTLERALQWKNSETCEYGTLCKPGGDCWGDSSDYCLLPKRDLLMHRTQKGEIKPRENWGKGYYVFARHSCVLDWECQVKTFTFPLHLDIETMRGATSLQNGTKFILNGGSQLVPLKPGEYFLIDTKDYLNAVLSEQVTVKCIYPAQLVKAVCIIQSGQHKGSVLAYSHTKSNGFEFFCNSYTCISFDRVKHLKAVKVDDIGDKAASLRDLSNLQSYIQAEMDKNVLNLAGILNHTLEMENIVLKMLKRLAQTDPLLMSWVLENDGIYMTRFMDHDTFTQCPCYSKVPDKSSVCNPSLEKSYIFKNGEFVNWDKKESCFSVNEKGSVLRNLTIVDNINIMRDYISPPNYVGASLQWQGWQWLNKYETDLLWTMRTTKTNNVASILNALDNPFFHPFNLLFSMLSGYISWIALLLSIFNCFKRY